jgi:hypothetical protein
MTKRERDLKAITRALVLTVSVSGTALTIAGCVPEGSNIEKSNLAEGKLYSQITATGDVRLIDSYLLTYPSSPRIPHLLDSLPSRSLVSVSRGAVASLPDNIKNKLSPRVRTALLGPPPPSQNVTGFRGKY